MATMSIRTTFALDEETVKRLKSLAARWRTSQAEVVRRAVAEAESRARAEGEKPLDSLRGYLAAGGLVKEKAEDYLRQLDEERSSWRGES